MPIRLNGNSGTSTNYSTSTWSMTVAEHHARLIAFYRQQQIMQQQNQRTIDQIRALNKEQEAKLKSDPFYSHPNFKVIQKIRAMNKKRQEAGYAF